MVVAGEDWIPAVTALSILVLVVPVGGSSASIAIDLISGAQGGGSSGGGGGGRNWPLASAVVCGDGSDSKTFYH